MRVYNIRIQYCILCDCPRHHGVKYGRRDRRPIRYEIEKSVISGSRPRQYNNSII